jgi:hypothetical protein
MKVTRHATPKQANSRVIRRSVALPRVLVEEVFACTPPEIGHNLNRLVASLLRDYVLHRQSLAFDEAMRQMAADPELQSASASITDRFSTMDMDGLRT